MSKARIYCKGERDYYGEFDCGWGAEFSCEECICNGGHMSPQTNKPFLGNRGLYPTPDIDDSMVDIFDNNSTY